MRDFLPCWSRCTDAGITLIVHAACRAAVYPRYRLGYVGSLVVSESGRELCALPQLSPRVDLAQLGYPGSLRLSCGHSYGVRVSYNDIFHAVSIEMSESELSRTYQRIKSHLDHGTSAWKRLSL
jgi:hypothetical protein